MSVAMKAMGPPLDLGDIADIEARLGVRLPEAYRDFLLAYNVAVPEPNEFQHGETEAAVTSFYGVSNDWLDDLVAENRMLANRKPKGVLAIADSEGGDVICLDLPTGRIYLWAHEEEAAVVGDEEPSFDNMYLLASSFPKFLQRLEPFDPESVHVDPGAEIIEFSPGAREKFKKYLKDPPK